MMIFGVVLISLFFVFKKSKIERENQPLSTCDKDGSSTVGEEPRKMKFSELKSTMAGNKNIVGYDFFMDDITKLKPSPDDTGLAVFFTGINYDAICPPNNTSESKCYTYAKGEQNIAYLIFGILMVLGGIIQLVIAAKRPKSKLPVKK